MHGTSSTKPPSEWPAPGSSSTSPEGETAISASWELEPQKAVMWLKQCHVYHQFSWEWCHHTKQKMVMTGDGSLSYHIKSWLLMVVHDSSWWLMMIHEKWWLMALFY